MRQKRRTKRQNYGVHWQQHKPFSEGNLGSTTRVEAFLKEKKYKKGHEGIGCIKWNTSAKKMEFFRHDKKCLAEAVDISSHILQRPTMKDGRDVMQRVWVIFCIGKGNDKCRRSLEMNLFQSAEDLQLRWWVMFKHNSGGNQHTAKSTLKRGTRSEKSEIYSKIMCLKLLLIDLQQPAWLGKRNTST